MFRLDEHESEQLSRLAAAIGASRTAVVQAIVAAVADVWGRRGWVPPEEWPADEYGFRDAAIRMRDHARSIDAERRRRLPPERRQ